MRYYRIVIVKQSDSQETQSGSVTVVGTDLVFTTHPNGTNAAPDMGALHVVWDIPVSSFDAPSGAAYVEIRGVDIYTISQASNLQGAKVTIYGGMGSGYPLAQDGKPGLLIEGSVFQAFGNWLNTDMSLNLLIQPFGVPIDDTNYPKLVWHWPKGGKISTAIQSMIAAAMPSYKCSFNLINDLVSGSDDLGYYPDFGSLAQVILEVSQHANKTVGYQGIKFYLSGRTFYFYDQGSKSSPIEIKFQDMIGQPTWLRPDAIMLQTVMRSDISINDIIKLPDFNQTGSNQVLTGYGSITPTKQNIQVPKDRSLFNGSFQVTSVRHIGDSRNPDGGSWVTVYEAVRA